MQRNPQATNRPASTTTIVRGLMLLLVLVAVIIALLAWLRPATGATAAGGAWSKQDGATVYSVASSADGAMILAGRRDNLVMAFDTSGTPLWETKTNGSVYGIAITSDGKQIAAASEDRNVYYLDHTGKELWKYRGPQTFTSVAISKDGAVVAAGNDDRKVYLFDRTGALRWTYAAADTVTAVAVYGSERGFRVLAGSRDSRVHLLSGDGKLLWERRLDYAVSGLGVTPNGRYIVVGDRGNSVSLLDGVSGAPTWSVDAGSPVLGVGISEDGQLIAAGTQAGELKILRQDGTIVQDQQTGAAVISLAMAPGRPDLVTGSAGSLTYLARTADTYSFVRPTSRILPITLGVIVVLGAFGGVLGLRRTRSGERAWRGYRHRGQRLGREIWRSRLSYLFLIPTLTLLLIFNYYPAFSGIVHAFSIWKPGVGTTWVGLHNFRILSADRYLWVGTWNAFLLIVTGFLKLAAPLLIAELIFHLRNDVMRYAMRTLFVLPLIVPGVVGILLWVNIYDPNIGLANQTFRALGLDSWARVWLGDEGTALWAIIFMGFPWVSAFALLIFYGGLISIPSELFDAAKVDGASGLRTFWSIHIPLLMGQFRLLLILGFIGGVQEFSAVFLTTGGGPGSATYVPALELYYQAVRFNNFGLASAIGAILFLIIMAGTIINIRYVKSSVEYTA